MKKNKKKMGNLITVVCETKPKKEKITKPEEIINKNKNVWLIMPEYFNNGKDDVFNDLKTDVVLVSKLNIE